MCAHGRKAWQTGLRRAAARLWSCVLRLSPVLSRTPAKRARRERRWRVVAAHPAGRTLLNEI